MYLNKQHQFNSGFLNIGQLNIVLIVTLFSVTASVLMTYIFLNLFDQEVTQITLGLAILPPLVIAPTASWYLTGLLYKVSKLEQEMRDLATHDMLTGLLTRRAFMNYSEQIYQLKKREKGKFVLIYMDLDYFKKINDTYGHAAGDKVVIAFAKLVSDSLRESDLVGRIGGEEFAILLPDTGQEGAIAIAEKILHKIRLSNVEYIDKSISFTASMGITEYKVDENRDLEELMIQADGALYRAKMDGRDCVITYDTILEAL